MPAPFQIPLFYDLDNRKWVVSSTSSVSRTNLVIGQGASVDFVVKFIQSGAVIELTTPSWIFGIKVLGDATGDYLLQTLTASKSGTGSSTAYTFSLTIDSTELRAFLLTATASTNYCALEIKDTFNDIVTLPALVTTINSDYLISGTEPSDANGTLTVASGKDAIISNSITLNGTDGSSYNLNSFGTGTVTSVSVTTANGVSGTVANSTTTPAISLTLGTITPTSVNGITLSGSGSLANSGTSSLTGFTGSGTSSGTNTGDQTSITGNAGTATALATARNIFNISFNGTANVAGDATNTGHFASVPGSGAAGHFITENGTAPTLIAGRSAWYSNGSGVPSFRNGTGTAVTLVRSSDLGTGIATFLATPSSANLAAAVTDETGSGALTFATSPTFTTSIIAGSSTMALFNTTATTINFGGGATTAINVGNSTGDFIVKSGELLPDFNDGTALGSSSKGFSDLFLASGAVINFNAGDVTITHSSNTLTVAGSSNLTVASDVTTGSGLAITSNTLSTGKLLSLASTSTATGTQYGLDVSLTGSYSSSAYTSYGVNVFNSRYGSYGSCTTYGALFTVSNPGSYSNTHYGVSSVVSNYQYGTGTNYGFHTSITNGGSSGTNYGVYSSVNSMSTTNYAGWFSAGSGTTNWAIYVSAGDVGTALTTLNCFNTTATTVNAFGAATLLTIGGAGASASMFAPSTLDATSSTTGAIRTSGGISAAKALNIGTTATIGGATAISLSGTGTGVPLTAFVPSLGSGFGVYITMGRAASNYNSASMGFVGVGSGTTTNYMTFSLYGVAATCRVYDTSFTPNANGSIDLGNSSFGWRQIYLDKTITAAATTGAQTINKSSGSVNFAAAATSLVVTNSLCTTSSVIHCTIATNDATAADIKVVAASGSFTIYLGVAPTAETRVNFLLTN